MIKNNKENIKNNLIQLIKDKELQDKFLITDRVFDTSLVFKFKDSYE